MSISPAAAHTLEVLGVLASASEPQAAATVARQLDLPRSTTYRLLATLERYGYVVHVAEDNRYALGSAAYELAWGYQRQAPLQRVARPLITRLAQQTGEAIHFSTLIGKDVLYVIEERGRDGRSLVTDTGVRLPAEVTASGRAMLARLTSAQISALYPATSALADRNGTGPRTITALRRLLAQVRATGYAQEDQEVSPGLASIAFAVVDKTGYPVGAVALTYAVERPWEPREDVAPPEALGSWIEHTRRTAAAITARLGGRAAARSNG